MVLVVVRGISVFAFAFSSLRRERRGLHDCDLVILGEVGQVFREIR